jgi:hypothetical protein
MYEDERIFTAEMSATDHSFDEQKAWNTFLMN